MIKNSKMVKIKIKCSKPDIISSYIRRNDIDLAVGVRSTSAARMTIYSRFVDFYTPDEIKKVLDHFENHPPPEEVQNELDTQLSGGD